MKWQVRTHPRAEADVAEARDWYDQQRPGLGREFLQGVRQALMELEQHPQRHAVYYRGLRRLLTHRFLTSFSTPSRTTAWKSCASSTAAGTTAGSCDETKLPQQDIEVAVQIARGDPVTEPGVPKGYPEPAKLVTADCIRAVES